MDETEALIADPATDSEMRGMAEQERADLRGRLAALDRELQILFLPRDAADASSPIVEIRAGTGGDEAALFAGDLLRMYQRYGALQGWKFEILGCRKATSAASRTPRSEVEGRGVYAKLKFESGVHRVQRVRDRNPGPHPHLRRHRSGSARSRGCGHRDP